jgi:hypothetical protein
MQRTFVRAMRWILFVLLLGAAAVALLGLPRAWGGATWLRILPLALLGLFIAGYAAYRLALVRAGRYPAGKALVQLGAMLLALGVIGGITLDRPRPVEPGEDLTSALRSWDPQVRVLAAELARYRPREQGLHQVGALVELLTDPEPGVRAQAHATLVALAGTDLGEGPASVERWQRFWRPQGPVPQAR